MGGKLKNKTVLITGASSGIGAATAKLFAEKGANVFLVARNEERLKKIKECCQKLGAKAEYCIADISESEQIQAAVNLAIDKFGALDIVHCNAGIYLRCAAKDLEKQQLQKIMNVNFYGTLNTVYAVLPYFLKRGGGSIITTCSMDGKKGVPPDSAYVASKFAINGFHQVLRQELKNYKIHVGMIFPSRTDTPQIAHVATPKITPKANPEKIAKAVVRCYLGKKSEVMVPHLPCKLLTIGEFLSPRIGDFMVRAFKLDGVQTSESVVKEKGL